MSPAAANATTARKLITAAAALRTKSAAICGYLLLEPSEEQQEHEVVAEVLYLVSRVDDLLGQLRDDANDLSAARTGYGGLRSAILAHAPRAHEALNTIQRGAIRTAAGWPWPAMLQAARTATREIAQIVQEGTATNDVLAN